MWIEEYYKLWFRIQTQVNTVHAMFQVCLSLIIYPGLSSLARGRSKESVDVWHFKKVNDVKTRPQQDQSGWWLKSKRPNRKVRFWKGRRLVQRPDVSFLFKFVMRQLFSHSSPAGGTSVDFPKIWDSNVQRGSWYIINSKANYCPTCKYYYCYWSGSQTNLVDYQDVNTLEHYIADTILHFTATNAVLATASCELTS